MPVSADPTLAKLRKSLGGSRYRALVKEAHARGYKVRSYAEGKASGTPEAMIERTQGSITREAERTVATAFKPAEQQLTTALQREQAIAAKREQDMLSFQQWASGQQQRFQQAAFAAQRQILGQNQEILAQQGAAKAASLQAAQAQLGGVGMGDAAQQAIQMRPDAVAAQAAARQQVGIAGQQATAAAGQATANLEFMGTNQLGSLAATAEKGRQADQEKVQAVKDRIMELHGKRGEALVNVISDLSKAEQQKAISKYEGEVAAAVASGKQAHEINVLGLKQDFSKGENAKDRAARLKLEQYKTKVKDADKALKDGLENDKFIARYGKTRDEYRKMTPGQRLRWQTLWNRTQGKGEKDPLAFTPQEARTKLDNIIAAARNIDLDDQAAKKKKGKGLTAAQIRQYLDDDDIPPSLQRYIVNIFKSGTRGVLSPAIRQELEERLGGHAKLPSNFLQGG